MTISANTNQYYPWGGEFTIGSPTGCTAVVLLTIEYTPPKKVAIYGPLKTENIGIEKIVANVISNPHIRYLVVCGEEIRGHRAGASLIALHKSGIDNQHRIINAPGAIPYIENLKKEALSRFQKQVHIIDLINVTNTKKITREINKCNAQHPSSFGKPYVAIRITPKTTASTGDARALHSRITIGYMGKIRRRET